MKILNNEPLPIILAILAISLAAVYFISRDKTTLPLGKYEAFSSEHPDLAPAYVDLYTSDTNGSSRFTFVFSPISSTIHMGSYEIRDNTLILTTDDGNNSYFFLIEGNSLIFRAERSTSIQKFRDLNIVHDKTVFSLVK